MNTKAIPLAERLWHEGVAVKKIAKACGLKEYELMNFACAHRDRFPARRVCNRLTDRQKEDIYALSDQGFGPTYVAKAVGCGVNSVARILKKRKERE